MSVNPILDLEDKVAIITGAASGMGAAEARLFIDLGARVVLTDRDPSGQDVADELGTSALFVVHDVTDRSAWHDVVSTAVDRFGKLDVLVNNAGYFKPATLMDTDAELLERHFRVNVQGVLLGIQAAAEVMTEQGRGSIVNISSLSAMAGSPGQAAYSTSKWASRGLIATAALELAPSGVRVNGVYPGAIDTPMLRLNDDATITELLTRIPLGRLGTTEDIAHTVAFLASDASAYYVGAEIAIGGGFH